MTVKCTGVMNVCVITVIQIKISAQRLTINQHGFCSSLGSIGSSAACLSHHSPQNTFYMRTPPSNIRPRPFPRPVLVIQGPDKTLSRLHTQNFLMSTIRYVRYVLEWVCQGSSLLCACYIGLYWMDLTERNTWNCLMYAVRLFLPRGTCGFSVSFEFRFVYAKCLFT